MTARLVFDSDSGRSCPECGEPVDRCTCKAPAPPPGDGIVRLRREVRRGKVVTVADGIPLAGAELKALAKRLKQVCSSGGSAADGTVEIQGEFREEIAAELRRRGFEVRGG